MKKNLPHIISTKSKTLFTGALPPEWICNPMQEDYGTDYLVQIFQSEQSTPFDFEVQLKGTDNPHITKGHYLVPVDVENLRDYAEKRRPIFLVVADNSNQRCCYLFLQRHLIEHLTGWRTKRRIKIRVPIANAISDHTRLVREVTEADNYVAAMHPLAIPIALAAAERRYAALDPRFLITATATKEATQYQLHAKETFTVQVHLASAKAKELLEFGRPVQFSADEVRFEGSDLLSELAKSGLTAQFHRDRLFNIAIVCVDDQGVDTVVVPTVPMCATGGTREARLEGGLPGDVIAIGITIRAAAGVPESATSNFRLSFASWENRPMRSLPYFEQVYALVRHMRTARKVLLRFDQQGNQFNEATLPPTCLPNLKLLSWHLHALHKLREIVRLTGIHDITARVFSPDEAEEIDWVHFILASDHPEQPAPNLVLNTVIRMEGLRQMLGMDVFGKPIDMEYTLCWQSQEFLGVPFNLHDYSGAVVTALTQVRSSLTSEEARALLDDVSQQEVAMSWHGTPVTQLSIRKEKFLRDR